MLAVESSWFAIILVPILLGARSARTRAAPEKDAPLAHDAAENDAAEEAIDADMISRASTLSVDAGEPPALT